MALYKFRSDGFAVVILGADGGVSQIPLTDPTYLAWVAAGNVADPPDAMPAAQSALLQLQANDATIFRALEILIDVLLAKGTIVATDFPPAVRALYLARKALRATAGV